MQPRRIRLRHVPVVHDLRYGSDGSRLYLRLDLLDDAKITQIDLATDKLSVPLLGNSEVEVARDKILEIGIPLVTLGAHRGDMVRFQLTLTSDGLPLDIVPQQGYIEFSTSDPTE